MPRKGRSFLNLNPAQGSSLPIVPLPIFSDSVCFHFFNDICWFLTEYGYLEDSVQFFLKWIGCFLAVSRKEFIARCVRRWCGGRTCRKSADGKISDPATLAVQVSGQHSLHSIARHGTVNAGFRAAGCAASSVGLAVCSKLTNILPYNGRFIFKICQYSVDNLI